MVKTDTLRSFLIIILLLPLSVGLFAQEETRGVIIYSSGNGFEQIRDGETREYDLSVDVVEGIELKAGDYLNIYNGTFLEIQLLPSENVLKVSENTSFKINELSEDGGGSFELNYGRVRARVKKLAGLERFSLEGPSMVAGVRGTDFGYDIVFEEDTENERTLASVYCFDGEVEVETKEQVREETRTVAEAGSRESAQADPDAGQEKKAKFVISADEMVRLVERRKEPVEQAPQPGIAEETGLEYLLVKEKLADSIDEYWRINDFEGELIEIREEREPPRIVGEEETQREQRRRLLRRSAAISGVIGIVFGAATLTFAYADGLVGDWGTDTRDGLTLAFGATTGLYLSTSLFSYLFSFR